MKRFNVCALFVAGVLAIRVVPAQETRAMNFIADDDGGVVQIVPVALTPVNPGRAHAAQAMQSIRQTSIFLGQAWQQAGVRNRETSLFDLADLGDLAPLRAQSIGILQASPSVEDFTDLTGPVNDLTIQHKLVEMLESKTLPAPDASTVFVVFLAPGVKLTVGSSTAGINFAAYHNLIHVEAGALRYVVVPFIDNASQHAKAASLAMLNTALNPSSFNPARKQ